MNAVTLSSIRLRIAILILAVVVAFSSIVLSTSAPVYSAGSGCRTT